MGERHQQNDWELLQKLGGLGGSGFKKLITYALETLMGAQQAQLNLRSLRLRAEELRRTVDQLLHTLQFAPATLQWGDALDKFAVLNVQLQHLQTQLRPLLQHYVVHPRSVNQSNAPVLPIMLATKLLPEQEAERDALLAAAAAEAGSGAGEGTAAAEGIAALNAAVDSLARAGGLLDARGKRRMEVAAAAKAAAEPHAASAAASEVAAALADARRAAGGAPSQPLLQSSDLLLAAASYGAGLC